MPGYIIVDVKTRKSLAICGAISVAVFLFGILIGYFSHPSSTSGGSNSSDKNESPNKGELGHLCREADFNAVEKGALYLRRKIERVQDNNACVQKPEDCGKFGLPRTYSAYHLNGKSLVVDGRLNDSAWAEVSKTVSFLEYSISKFLHLLKGKEERKIQHTCAHTHERNKNQESIRSVINHEPNCAVSTHPVNQRSRWSTDSSVISEILIIKLEEWAQVHADSDNAVGFCKMLFKVQNGNLYSGSSLSKKITPQKTAVATFLLCIQLSISLIIA